MSAVAKQPKLKQLGIGTFCSPQRQNCSNHIPPLTPATKECLVKPKKTIKKFKTSKKMVFGTNNVKYKLDGWLSKESIKHLSKCKPEDRNTQSANNHVHQTPNKMTKKQQKDAISCEKGLDYSDRKYSNIRMPSFKDILHYQEVLQSEKACLEDLDSLYCSQTSIELSDIDDGETKVLDCKHIPLDELTVLYRRHFNIISSIFYGTQYSERHERFQQPERYKGSVTERDLRYNISMISFTFDQKDFLLDMLHKDFVEEIQGQNSQYFCKVLLPELCLMIFMDVHCMKKEEAMTYLENH